MTASSNALLFVQHHGYFLLFLLFIVEGPLFTYAAAFAASLGLFNVYLVLLVSILGNVIGDLLYYSIGRLGKKMHFENYFTKKIQKSKVKKIISYLKKNPGKTLAVIKLTPPLPLPGLILAGSVDTPLPTFLFYSFLITILSSTLIVILGYYSGTAFEKIATYLNYGEILIGVAFIFVILFYLLMKFLFRSVSHKIEKID